MAILAGIPKNIKEADLLEIASQVNAKAVNIPLSFNSYKPKPYTYLNFSSFESLEAAKEMTIAFCNKGLICSSSARSPAHFPRNNTLANSQGNVRVNVLSAQDNAKLEDAIAQQLHALDDKVSWMEYSIMDHEYRLKELDLIMNLEGPSENDSSYPPNSYINDNDSSSDTSFFALNPNSVLSSRHSSLSLSGPDVSSNDPARLRQEISMVTNTHHNLSNQLGISSPPPDSTINLTQSSPPSHYQDFDISPDQFNQELYFSNILRISTLNVRFIVHSSKQLNLFSLLLLHQLHSLILTETNLRTPAHKFVAYVPPSSGFNNKLISECHTTLISWITAAHSTGTHVLLGSDLNAEFDAFLKNISNPTISSPVHPLFQYLHSHQFDDLCAFDASSSPMSTFKSSSSGHLF
ncbi:hypothetical protein RhiirA4_455441 [Rhizophagus irregularis]|uniref:RRM domain-containing protein n=1 Tax=Rhizophagus irregularis TaxID=588596 RepID=A0A2I1G580_9GLOM|nr:hypothetical protein RhiirA4_455441 [Rhizophagus irregularis]